MWSFEDLPGPKIDLCQSVDFIPLLTNAGKTDEIDKLFSKKWKKVANKINLEESGARRAIIFQEVLDAASAGGSVDGRRTSSI
jgi:hypothetical protein